MTATRRFWITFGVWFFLLATLDILLDLTYAFSPPPMLPCRQAGFPLPFAYATFQEWDTFDPRALAVDIVVGVAICVGLPLLCASSRCRSG